MEKLEEDELDEDAGFEYTEETYSKLAKSPGNGLYRIGKTLKGKINNDLYGMIWACCFRAEYVLALKRAEDEKGDLDDKVIDDYKAKKLEESMPLNV